MKRFLASLMAAVLLVSTAMTGVVPASAAEPENEASKYVTLDGDWHYKLYRTYPNMFQYFAFTGVSIKTENLLLCLLPRPGRAGPSSRCPLMTQPPAAC